VEEAGHSWQKNTTCKGSNTHKSGQYCEWEEEVRAMEKNPAREVVTIQGTAF
jgi:hypothetical protein